MNSCYVHPSLKYSSYCCALRACTVMVHELSIQFGCGGFQLQGNVRLGCNMYSYIQYVRMA